VQLTDYEFAERVCYAIDDPHLPSQMAMFVQLYYESFGYPKRWKLLQNALEAADISREGLVMIAKLARKYL
jgi:hypothetical protein